MVSGASASERLRAAAEAGAGGCKVRRVCIGLSYTAVQLEDGSCGVAMTSPGAGTERECCAIREDGGPLAGRPARELLGLLASEHAADRAVGLACANALLNRPRPGEREGDALEVVDLRDGDRVGMVGCFWPMLEGLRGRVKELLVFERKENREDFWLPAEEAPKLLPGCQAALITSSSLLNGAWCASCASPAVDRSARLQKTLTAYHSPLPDRSPVSSIDNEVSVE